MTRRSTFIRIVFAFVCALLTASCSRTPPGHVTLKLDREQVISLGLLDAKGALIAQPLVAKHLGPGVHQIDCRAGTPKGSWTWRAVGHDPIKPEWLATLAGGVADFTRIDDLGAIAGGDAGPPSAVAADDRSVFLAWRAAVAGHEIVAVDPTGRVLWAHHHGPMKSGVEAVAASDGIVFVLGSGENEDSRGTFIYKLDAQTGAALPWKGRDALDIQLTSLWPDGPGVKPSHGGAIATKNGRVYVTFMQEEFIAALDAASGDYVITLSGPKPTQMALSTTPMTDPQNPGQIKVIDFGVCALAGNGLAYFVMEHDPAWVMASTTRWLQDDERIVAVALTGDTMKTGEATIHTALGEPHHQVQLRPVEDAETFKVAVGRPGGRSATGPWEADGMRDIRAIAVDATGQIWVAEGDDRFGRFSVWRTDGKQGALVREIFGPMEAPPSPDQSNAMLVSTGELQWQIDPSKHLATLISRLEKPVESPTLASEMRDETGLLLWTPESDAIDARLQSGKWSVWRAADQRVFGACMTRSGTEVFALPGLNNIRAVGMGTVTIVAQ